MFLSQRRWGERWAAAENSMWESFSVPTIIRISFCFNLKSIYKKNSTGIHALQNSVNYIFSSSNLEKHQIFRQRVSSLHLSQVSKWLQAEFWTSIVMLRSQAALESDSGNQILRRYHLCPNVTTRFSVNDKS